MPPVYSCLHCQFLSHVLKALFFKQNSPKMKLFLQKNAKFLSSGGFAPKPPDPHWPPAAGGSAPRPPKQPPNCEFLATRLSSCITKGVRLCLRSLVTMWSIIVEDDEVTLVGIVMIGKAPLLRIMFRYSIAVLLRLLLSVLMLKSPSA